MKKLFAYVAFAISISATSKAESALPTCWLKYDSGVFAASIKIMSGDTVIATMGDLSVEGARRSITVLVRTSR